jgi:hypothetical protein
MFGFIIHNGSEQTGKLKSILACFYKHPKSPPLIQNPPEEPPVTTTFPDVHPPSKSFDSIQYISVVFFSITPVTYVVFVILSILPRSPFPDEDFKENFLWRYCFNKHS